MRHLKLKLSLPFLHLALLLASAVSADDSGYNVATVKQHIIPAYARMAGNSQAMQQQADRFCAAPDAQGLQQLQDAFHQSLDAWQSIQHIRFGPIEFSLRMNRLQLWPDKRSSVSKHLNKFLAARDFSALQEESFTKGSVALQGFSALERLLFGKQTSASNFAANGNNASFECALLKAITSNLATISARLEKEWSQGKDAYLNFIATAAEGNDFYESDTEVSSLMLNNLHTQMQVIVDQKLDRPLDKSLRKARGTRAENWRSGRSLRNIRLNLQGLQEFYNTAFRPRLSDSELNSKIEDAFNRSLQTTDAISMPLDLAVKDPHARTQVEALRTSTSRLKNLIARELPQKLGLSLGFNSLDGD